MAVDWLGLYLLEDVGAGDVTSDALFGPDRNGSAHIVARERMVLAGGAHAGAVFARLGANATVRVTDGKWVESGTMLLSMSGPVRALLAGERLALNILARMAGIATTTRQCVDAVAVAGGKARVAGTRKTTPGFRFFEKEAIAVGGGERHRMGLWDEAMLKDNHLEAWCQRPLGEAQPADVAAAVAAVVAANPGRNVCCEVESLPHAMAAAGAGATWILVDNQPAATGQSWAQEVRRVHPNTRIEASGSITPANIASYGWADRVSLGWLTQKAPACDISMEWGQQRPAAGEHA